MLPDTYDPTWAVTTGLSAPVMPTERRISPAVIFAVA